VINLGYIGQDSNIFELAATYVDFSILPLFQDYKSKSVGAGSQGADVSSGSAAGLDNILKGLSSLKMNLAQCRQNQDIPNVDFPIEPIIKARIESARERKQICNINEFDDIAQDKYFLNSLNNYVNNWYRDIRKVTGLDHAIESGNALQEINFWQQMEQRLTTIKEKQGSEEVLMTLNILSQAKRYMTVMTFQHDTDIDPKLKTAKDYNKLLKEIPILSLYDAMTL
jgi:dynein heavy chain 1